MSIRLFVAADLPAPVRSALAAFRDAADPAIWRPAFAILIAVLVFHAFVLASIAFRVGLQQNPVWPAGHWLVLQAAAIGALVGIGVAFH